MIAVAWDIRNDHDPYMAASWLQLRHRSRWIVMWGPGSRDFFAFYRGRAHGPGTAPPDPAHRNGSRNDHTLRSPLLGRHMRWTSRAPPYHLTEPGGSFHQSGGGDTAIRASRPLALTCAEQRRESTVRGALGGKPTFTRSLGAGTDAPELFQLMTTRAGRKSSSRSGSVQPTTRHRGDTPL